MPFTHFLADELIDYIRTTYPTTYLALYTVSPTLSGGGTEVTGGSYARAAVDTDDYFPASASSSTASDTEVAFATATASWGTIVAVGLKDALTSGNLLAYYVLPTPRVIGNGDNYAFPIGNLIIRNES